MLTAGESTTAVDGAGTRTGIRIFAIRGMFMPAVSSRRATIYTIFGVLWVASVIGGTSLSRGGQIGDALCVITAIIGIGGPIAGLVAMYFESTLALQTFNRRRGARVNRLVALLKRPDAERRLPHRALEFSLLTDLQAGRTPSMKPLHKLPRGVIVCLEMRPCERPAWPDAPIPSEPLDLYRDHEALERTAAFRRSNAIRSVASASRASAATGAAAARSRRSRAAWRGSSVRFESSTILGASPLSRSGR